ncbi:unnamed protein product [Somion occarium]
MSHRNMSWLKGLLAPFFLTAAFLLLLLISLSSPIIGSIFLFGSQFHINSPILAVGVSGSARFGLSGYCITVNEFRGVSVPIGVTATQCLAMGIGYTMSPTYLGNVIEDDSPGMTVELFAGPTLSRPLSSSLVLVPIACAFTLLALVSSLLTLNPKEGGPSRLLRVFTVGSVVLSALLATAATIDAFVVVAKVNDSIATSSQIYIYFGNAVWMALAAGIAAYCAVVSVLGTIYGFRKRVEVKAEVDNFDAASTHSTIVGSPAISLKKMKSNESV